MPPRFLYRWFPRAARASRWLEQRFTSGGRLLLGVLVTGAILGIDISQTLAYQLATLAFALLVTSFVLSARWRPRLAVRRVLPQVVTAQLASHYWLEITNLGTRVESELWVQDTLLDPPLSWSRFQALRDRDAQAASNWFDRAVGFPRWVALRRRLRGAELASVAVPTLAPGATVRVKIAITALRRGWLQYTQLRLLRPDPLGLCRARARFTLSDRLLALPHRHPLPRIHLHSERRYQPGGVSLALAVGDSQEFAALRDYQPGDARRHIHWRSFAKTGQLIVKQYQDEYFDRHALVVDTHLADAAARFEAVIEIAASIVSGPRPRDSILDLVIAGTDILELSAGRGLGDGMRALTYLAEASAVEGEDFAAVATLMRARIGRLASVILVFGHYDDARRALVDELARHDIATLCLQVVADDLPALAPRSLGAGYHYRLHVDRLAADLARLSLGP